VKILAKSRGIVAALVTPFTANGEVNDDALAELCEHTIRLGVGGLYICGTTGEGLFLSEAERERVVKAVVKASAGRADVIVNISHMDIRQVHRQAAYAADAGADAVSSLPPLFYSMTNEDLVRYFRAILDSTELPFTIYNIPQLSHCRLDPAVVRVLVEVPKFVGIKHTSDENESLRQFKQVDNGRLIVWCGRDASLIEQLKLGADGAIGSSYQLLGNVFAKILSEFRAGRNERAALLQLRINEVHGRLQTYGAIQSIKRCLTLLKIPCSDCRLPLATVRTDIDEYHRGTLEIADRVRIEFDIP
jgi:N-acetylneuraminate lyase